MLQFGLKNKKKQNKMPLLTDDCDINKNTLDVFCGNDGDIYISIITEKAESHAVRIAMSGGIAPTSVKIAAANLYREMKKHGLSE